MAKLHDVDIIELGEPSYFLPRLFDLFCTKIQTSYLCFELMPLLLLFQKHFAQKWLYYLHCTWWAKNEKKNVPQFKNSYFTHEKKISTFRIKILVFKVNFLQKVAHLHLLLLIFSDLSPLCPSEYRQTLRQKC